MPGTSWFYRSHDHMVQYFTVWTRIEVLIQLGVPDKGPQYIACFNNDTLLGIAVLYRDLQVHPLTAGAAVFLRFCARSLMRQF
jgi:hypothetical protein